MKKLVLLVAMLTVLVAGLAPTAAFAETTGSIQQPIVGGTDVEDGKYSFIVALLQKRDGEEVGSHFCGGSLIDQDSVLTAAHCVEGMKASDLQVGFGKAQISGLNKAWLRDVDEIYIHNLYKWDGKTLDYDVAVLKLSHPINVKGIGWAVPTDEGSEVFEKPGTLLTVAGWGRTKNEPGSKPDRMQEAQVPVVSDDEGAKVYSKSWMASRMIAAGKKGTTHCQGDSGGPLFAKQKNGSYVVVGVVSNGLAKCGEKPRVYAEVNEPRISNFIASYAALPANPAPEPNPNNRSDYTDGNGIKHTVYQDKYGRWWDSWTDEGGNKRLRYTDTKGISHERYQDKDGGWWDTWTDEDGNKHVGTVDQHGVVHEVGAA